MKPGYKTGAFWAVVAATVATALGAAGVLPMVLDQPVQLVVLALASAGYTSLRTWAKGTPAKPAWRTTEFWLSAAAAVVAAVTAAGVFRDGSVSAQILGWAAAALAALGYPTGRALGRGV